MRSAFNGFGTPIATNTNVHLLPTDKPLAVYAIFDLKTVGARSRLTTRVAKLMTLIR